MMFATTVRDNEDNSRDRTGEFPVQGSIMCCFNGLICVLFVRNYQVNTLWGSFEIRNVRLVKMMLCQYSG